MMEKKQILSLTAAALMLVPAPAGAKAKKKEAEKQLSAIEIVDKVNSHWQANNKPERSNDFSFILSL